jgi:hypothetical protein
MGNAVSASYAAGSVILTRAARASLGVSSGVKKISILRILLLFVSEGNQSVEPCPLWNIVKSGLKLLLDKD